MKTLINLLLKIAPKIKRTIGRAIRKFKGNKKVTEKILNDYIENMSKKDLEDTGLAFEKLNDTPFLRRYNRNIRPSINRVINGKATIKDNKIIEMHTKLFVKTNAWFDINSSWIKRARYVKKHKTLYVFMVRSMKKYEFNNVPIAVWIHLTTLPANAGTWWWNAGIGAKFSSNPSNWIRKGKK